MTQDDDFKLAAKVLHEVYEIHAIRKEFLNTGFTGEDLLDLTRTNFNGGPIHQAAVNVEKAFLEWLSKNSGS